MKKIIDTTIKLINEKGYNSISTNEIAREANINISLLYRYFEGKPGIIKEIISRGYAEFFEKANLDALTKENLPQFLKLFLSRYLEQHRKNRSLIVAMEMALLSNTELFKDFEYIRSELKLIPIISRILTQLGYPEKENIDQISKLFLYSIDSLVHKHIVYGKIVEKDEDLVDFMVELIRKFIDVKD